MAHGPRNLNSNRNKGQNYQKEGAPTLSKSVAPIYVMRSLCFAKLLFCLGLLLVYPPLFKGLYFNLTEFDEDLNWEHEPGI